MLRNNSKNMARLSLLLALLLLTGLSCSKKSRSTTGPSPSDVHRLIFVDRCPLDSTLLFVDYQPSVDGIDTLDYAVDLDEGLYLITLSRYDYADESSHLLAEFGINLNTDITCEVCSSYVTIGGSE